MALPDRRILAALLAVSVFFIIPLSSAQTECTSGEKKNCVTVQDCNGIQKCIDGHWSECLIESMECEYGKKTACVPKINGVDCNSISGIRRCGICGQWLEQCDPYSARVECCPGRQRVCDVTSSQECGKDGRWGYCFDGQSCKSVKCDDNESCTTDRCALGKCLFTRIEKCCHSDKDCSSSERCTNGKCVAIDCGECFEAIQWQCVPKTKGICCNDHWNNGLSSCDFDYSSVSQSMEGVEDARALAFFEMGEDAVAEGRIELGKYYFQVAATAAMLAGRYSDYNSEILSAFDEKFDAIEDELEKGNFSAMKSFQWEISALLRQVKPAGQGGDSDSNRPVTPTPVKPAPETPWLIVIPLVLLLAVMIVIFSIQIRKKGESKPPQEEGKKEQEIEVPAGEEENQEPKDSTFSDLFG